MGFVDVFWCIRGHSIHAYTNIASYKYIVFRKKLSAVNIPMHILGETAIPRDYKVTRMNTGRVIPGTYVNLTIVNMYG